MIRVCALVAVVALVGCKKKADKVDPSVITQRYKAPNGLIGAGYPADFTAKAIGDDAILVARTVGGQEERVTLVSVAHPASRDLDAFAAAQLAEDAKPLTSDGATYAETTRRKATCFGLPAIETIATWTRRGVPYRRWSCVFLHFDQGYSLSYALPESLVADEPLLRHIVDRSTLTKR